MNNAPPKGTKSVHGWQIISQARRVAGIGAHDGLALVDPAGNIVEEIHGWRVKGETETLHYWSLDRTGTLPQNQVDANANRMRDVDDQPLIDGAGKVVDEGGQSVIENWNAMKMAAAILSLQPRPYTAGGMVNSTIREKHPNMPEKYNSNSFFAALIAMTGYDLSKAAPETSPFSWTGLSNLTLAGAPGLDNPHPLPSLFDNAPVIQPGKNATVTISPSPSNMGISADIFVDGELYGRFDWDETKQTATLSQTYAGVAVTQTIGGFTPGTTHHPAPTRTELSSNSGTTTLSINHQQGTDVRLNQKEKGVQTIFEAGEHPFSVDVTSKGVVVHNPEVKRDVVLTGQVDATVPKAEAGKLQDNWVDLTAKEAATGQEETFSHDVSDGMTIHEFDDGRKEVSYPRDSNLSDSESAKFATMDAEGNVHITMRDGSTVDIPVDDDTPQTTPLEGDEFGALPGDNVFAGLEAMNDAMPETFTQEAHPTPGLTDEQLARQNLTKSMLSFGNAPEDVAAATGYDLGYVEAVDANLTDEDRAYYGPEAADTLFSGEDGPLNFTDSRTFGSLLGDDAANALTGRRMNEKDPVKRQAMADIETASFQARYPGPQKYDDIGRPAHTANVSGAWTLGDWAPDLGIARAPKRSEPKTPAPTDYAAIDAMGDITGMMSKPDGTSVRAKQPSISDIFAEQRKEREDYAKAEAAAAKEKQRKEQETLDRWKAAEEGKQQRVAENIQDAENAAQTKQAEDAKAALATQKRALREEKAALGAPPPEQSTTLGDPLFEKTNAAIAKDLKGAPLSPEMEADIQAAINAPSTKSLTANTGPTRAEVADANAAQAKRVREARNLIGGYGISTTSDSHAQDVADTISRHGGLDSNRNFKDGSFRDETGRYTGEVGVDEQGHTVNAFGIRTKDVIGYSGSDSGKNTRVICTELVRQKMMDAKLQRLDMAFTFARLSPTHVKGYHAWAIPYVRLMRRPGLVGVMAVSLMEPLARARAEEVTYQLTGKGKPNLLGKLVRAIGEPLCWIIGRVLEMNDGYGTPHLRRA